MSIVTVRHNKSVLHQNSALYFPTIATETVSRDRKNISACVSSRISILRVQSNVVTSPGVSPLNLFMAKANNIVYLKRVLDENDTQNRRSRFRWRYCIDDREGFRLVQFRDDINIIFLEISRWKNLLIIVIKLMVTYMNGVAGIYDGKQRGGGMAQRYMVEIYFRTGSKNDYEWMYSLYVFS